MARAIATTPSESHQACPLKCSLPPPAALVDVEAGELPDAVALVAAASGFTANTPPKGSESGVTLVFTEAAASLYSCSLSKSGSLTTPAIPLSLQWLPNSGAFWEQ